tara:strand:+ start:1110 stop:1472 length:363 start_codon:yes stop_codon:yes gene_type:complete
MSEDRLQSEIIKYLQLQYPKARYCASMGGQYQPYKSQQNRMKRTGYVKGFPDLQITEARDGYFGLFLEIKTIKGRATIEQKRWIVDLLQRGYQAKIVKGLPQALDEIDKYMTKPETKRKQ